MSEPIFADVDRYLGELFGSPDPVFEQALVRARDAGLPPINISATLGRLLQVLALIRGARSILEIGTLGGYSTIWLARALPADGTLISLEFEPHHAEVARANLADAGFADRTEIRVGPAVASLDAMIEAGREPFDMVFIDADKESYPDYLQRSIQLAAPGALIVADNVVRGGKVAAGPTDDRALNGIQQFNRMVTSDPRLTSSIVQTISGVSHDGVALAVVGDPGAR